MDTLEELLLNPRQAEVGDLIDNYGSSINLDFTDTHLQDRASRLYFTDHFDTQD